MTRTVLVTGSASDLGTETGRAAAPTEIERHGALFADGGADAVVRGEEGWV